MNTEEHISFRVLYHQLYGRALRFAQSYVRDESVAEDLVADAMIRLWLEQKQQTIERPSAFLFTILRNSTLDYLKHQAVKEEKLAALSEKYSNELSLRISLLQASDPNEVFVDDIQNIVRNTLSQLPPKTRRIFQLSRQNYRIQEIADQMKLSTKAVEYHLHKATKQLRLRLKDYL